MTSQSDLGSADPEVGAAAQAPGPGGMGRAGLRESSATDADIQIVRRTQLFARLPEPLFASLLNRHAVRSAEKDARLLTQGESAACVYFLLSGLVKLSRAGAGGDAAVLLVEGVGRPLLLAESLSGKPWPADAQAVTPVRLMCFDAAVLREAMKQERAFALSVLAAASLDLHQLISQVEELKAMTGPGRIAALILNLVDEREGAARVKLPYAKQLVAARLGMTPESFSRAMRRLAAQGVKPRGDELIVADLEKIVAFVENGGRDESAR